MLDNTQFHKSVLLKEVLENLEVKNNEIYVDGTFGAGGYSKAILEEIKKNKFNSKVIGIDRDETVLKFVQTLDQSFPDNFKFLSGKFSKIDELLAQIGVEEVDGLVLDIGVSSMQFDEMERGFSFDSDAKLDMRMDRSSEISAFEVVNNFQEKDLAQIIWEFGEEKKSRLIAREILKRRQQGSITTCKELAEIVRHFYKGYFKTDPATKTFQALRIYVNQELEELKQVLQVAKKILKKGGRLIVVSFHSLEDKIVKDFLKKESGLDVVNSRYLPVVENKNDLSFCLKNKSAICPNDEEIKFNPRARSAKMRVGYRL